MSREEKLFLPRGDDYTAPINALERAIASLPLEDCELVRNVETDTLEFIPPAGKAFRIAGEGLRADSYKPWAYVSRHESDGPIPKDPLSIDVAPWDDIDVGEHIATRLTLKTNHHTLGRTPIVQEEWTQHPYSVSSDEVEVEVVLLDHIQAWTYTGLRPLPWKSNNSEWAESNPALVEDNEHHCIAIRQSMVCGRVDEVTVELVDIDSDKFFSPDDDVIRSSDGRELQIAGLPHKVEGISRVELGYMSAAAYDEHCLKYGLYRENLANLPKEERISLLWRSRKRILLGGSGKREETPFSDDPLGHFVLVERYHDNGQVPTMDDLMYAIRERARISAMTPNELDEEIEKGPSRRSFENMGRRRLEVIQSSGSLAVSVRQQTAPGWEFAAGQRYYHQRLFGQDKMPHSDRTTKRLSKLSLSEAIAEFASEDWHLKEVCEETARTHSDW